MLVGVAVPVGILAQEVQAVHTPQPVRADLAVGEAVAAVRKPVAPQGVAVVEWEFTVKVLTEQAQALILAKAAAEAGVLAAAVVSSQAVRMEEVQGAEHHPVVEVLFE